MPEAALQRWIGGAGRGAIGPAAIIGAPLPLCSRDAIPTGIALHRAGAGHGPTTAFMISTPGVGADSVAVTYALLGPVMMLARLCGALAAALLTGVLVATVRTDARGGDGASGVLCRAKGCAGGSQTIKQDRPFSVRLGAGVRHAFTDSLDDIDPWMVAGLAVAGLLLWSLPPEALAGVLSGLPATLLLIAVIGVPIHVCAIGPTPIGAAMLLAGASPGTVLVFLLAGPITSLPTLTTLRREMGSATLLRHVFGVVATAILAGLALDQIVHHGGIDILWTLQSARSLVPEWLSWLALGLLLLAGLRPVRRTLLRLA